MATLRDLKGRIGSVGSSEKITGAMKMISSAKMHKAEGAIKRLLPFRTQLESIIGNLLQADTEFTSPFTEARDVRRVYVVALGSDDGLCGAYNVNIFKQLTAHIDALRAEAGDDMLPVTVFPVGGKMLKACRRMVMPGVSVAEDCGVNSKSTDVAVKEFVTRLGADFTDGLTDRVDFLYMSYQSVSRQRLTVQQILPVLPANIAGAAGKVSSNRPYIFEPDAETIFRTALPLMVLSSVQEIFCENRASEQAARVMAMQSANDNAKKLLEQLSLEYNKLRQQSITNELLDILGGQVK